MSIFSQSRWVEKKTKLAILIPCRNQVDTIFTQCLVELVKTTEKAGVDVEVLYDMSTILLNQRENLAKAAVETNAEYSLWLDSDMMFPSTTALRLMAHGKPVVAANYMKRSVPLTTVAYTKIGDWDSWLPLESQDGLERVEGIGMGVFMMETQAFLDIPKPLFSFNYDENGWHGEDFYFQQKLRDLGHSIFVDMNLSRQIRHIGQWAFGHTIGTNDDQIVKRHQAKRNNAS